MKKIHIIEDDYSIYFEKSKFIYLGIQSPKYISMILRKGYLPISRVFLHSGRPFASIGFKKNEKIQISKECLRKYVSLKSNI